MQISLICLALVLPFAVCEEYIWAHTTYLDVDITFSCNDSRSMLIAGEDLVFWKTPSMKELRPGHDDDVYHVVDLNGVQGHSLTIKKVSASVHGVYVCVVHNSSSDHPRTTIIRGLNIYEHLYRDQLDKYRENIIVAVIAALVFLVPMVTSCVVYKCRYITDEDKETMRQRKSGHHNQEVAMPYIVPDESERKVRQLDLNSAGGYDNPVITPL